jgi:hypothetical protein
LEALEGRRCGSGWQINVVLVTAKIADGKKPLFWSPPWRRTAKDCYFGRRNFSGGQKNVLLVTARTADAGQRLPAGFSPVLAAGSRRTGANPAIYALPILPFGLCSLPPERRVCGCSIKAEKKPLNHQPNL